MAPSVYGRHDLLVEFMGHAGPVRGHVLGIAFAADPWGLTFALLASLLGAVLVLAALTEMGHLGKRELGGFGALFLLLCAALIGAALTADLFNLFVWFEVAAIASYALTAFFLERPIALEAAFKILVLTTIASFAIFLAVGLLYARHGALNFAQLHDALAAHTTPSDLAALGLLIAGFATKAGLVPFHGWLPDAHTAAPGTVSALFSALMVNLGIVAVGRIVFDVFGTAHDPRVLGLLMVLGLVSAVAGAGFALVQDDLKRLLAYDTISQMGILVVGVATGSPEGLAGSSYHMIDHALFKALLFLCAGAIVHMTGATHLSEMGGLARRYPLLAVAFCVGVLSIAGVPPFNGYVSLGLIHDSLVKSGQWVPYALTVLAQVLAMAALGKAAFQAFFGARRAEGELPRDESLHPGLLGALGLLAAGCVAFGVFPYLVLDHAAAPAAGGLLHPARYAHGVLSYGTHLISAPVSFDYVSALDLGVVAGTVLAAIPVALAAIRWGAARPVALVRRIQTGSVNDYAAYQVGGLIAVVAVVAGVALFG